MKKFFSLILTAVLLFSFAGCSKRKSTALVISGTEIDSEIYAYYLDKVTSRPEDYGLNANPPKDDARDAAVKQCVRYIAINTDFYERELTLSAAEKVTVAENVNNYWIRFENHYDKIGVSRETLTKIFTSDAYEDAIFDSIYDKGVNDTAEEAIIKRYFKQNYVAFRSICAYFTDSEGADITSLQKEQIIEDFKYIAGATSSTFSERCTEKGYTSSDVIVLEKDSDGYPNGFFEKVAAQGTGKINIYIYDECIFAVVAESLDDLGDGVYANYRSTCIEDMYGDDWESYIEDYSKNFTVDEIKVK